ncbi:MAG TPA: hypothetical protein VIS07_11760 [Candidatus Binatia bacterium]
MPSLLDRLSPLALLDCGRASLADALRAVATWLVGVADAIAPGASAATSTAPIAAPIAAEAPLPGAGTRERIAETLARARTHLDAVSDPPRGPRRPRR